MAGNAYYYQHSMDAVLATAFILALAIARDAMALFMRLMN